MKHYKLLNEMKLFESMTHTQIDDILQAFRTSLAAYEKGEYIIRAHDAANYICILVEGTANIIKEQIWGDISLISELEAGDMFAESFAIASTTHIPISVIATGKCKVLQLNYHEFVKHGKSHHLFALVMQRLIEMIATKNVAMNNKMNILNQRTIRDKVLLYLKTMAVEKESDSFTIPFDRSELADYLGVDRSALSRELGAMKKAGLISFHKNNFTLFKNKLQ